MENKKSIMFTGEILLKVLISVVVIFLLGYVLKIGYERLTRSGGIASLIIFQDNFQKNIESRKGVFKGVSLFEQPFPYIDRLYIFDENKKQEMSGFLENEPLIKAALETDKNTILEKDNSVEHSFKLEGIRLDFPYYLCVENEGRFEYIVHNTGELKGDVMLYPGCEAETCNFVPETLTSEDIEKLLDNACCTNPKDQSTCDNACKEAERKNIKNAEGNLNVQIKVNSCNEGTTQVEFIIKPREGIAGKEVKFFETIDKSCVPNLKDFLNKIEGGDIDIIMKEDPLIVWTFSTVDVEKRVAYEIDKYLDDKCRKGLKATAGARFIEENKQPDPTPAPEHPERFNPNNEEYKQPKEQRSNEFKDFDLVSNEFEREEVKEEEIKTETKTEAGQEFDFIELKGIDLEEADTDFEIEETNPTKEKCEIVEKHKIKCPKGQRVREVKAKDKVTGALRRSHLFRERENEKPEIDLKIVGDLTFDTNLPNILGGKIWEFASDTEDTNPQNMIYDVVRESGSTNIDCNINNGEIDCTISAVANNGEKAKFKVTVTDSGGKTDDDTFTVTKG